jgi:hypothetical protein
LSSRIRGCLTEIYCRLDRRGRLSRRFKEFKGRQLVVQYVTQGYINGCFLDERTELGKYYTSIQPDSEGRLTLPREMLAWAGLESEVVLITSRESFEIWGLSAWGNEIAIIQEILKAIKIGYDPDKKRYYTSSPDQPIINLRQFNALVDQASENINPNIEYDIGLALSAWTDPATLIPGLPPSGKGETIKVGRPKS